MSSDSWFCLRQETTTNDGVHPETWFAAFWILQSFQGGDHNFEARCCWACDREVKLEFEVDREDVRQMPKSLVAGNEI